MNYYNEFDKNAAAWLRELINQGLIPNGDVDERSIKDVKADDLRGYTQCHFFAGIGGWSLALRLAGWTEDKPCWTGSCPCQAFSVAGKQLGVKDERDLWPVFYELIRECRPEYVFGEQVENAIKHGWLDRVYTDLEEKNYTVRAVVLGAHSVNAPHQRQRLYWGGMLSMDDSSSNRLRGRNELTVRQGELLLEGSICYFNRVADGERKQCKGGIPRQGINSPEMFSGETAESSGYCAVCGLSNTVKQGLQGCREFGNESLPKGWQGAERHTSEISLQSLSPWSDSAFILCTDGKVRRVPAESVFLGVADGVSEGVDTDGNSGIPEAERGFPLCKKDEIEGRVMLLKAYGNAIVPELAAGFITAFMEEIK